MADDSQNTLNTLRAAFPAFNVSEVTRTSRQYEFTPKAPGVNAAWVDKFTDQFAKFRDENFPDTHGDYTFGIENVNQAGARSNAPGFRLDANSVDTYAGKFAQHRNGLANLTNSASDTIRNAQTQYNKAITDLQTAVNPSGVSVEHAEVLERGALSLAGVKETPLHASANINANDPTRLDINLNGFSAKGAKEFVNNMNQKYGSNAANLESAAHSNAVVSLDVGVVGSEKFRTDLASHIEQTPELKQTLQTQTAQAANAGKVTPQASPASNLQEQSGTTPGVQQKSQTTHPLIGAAREAGLAVKDKPRNNATMDAGLAEIAQKSGQSLKSLRDQIANNPELGNEIGKTYQEARGPVGRGVPQPMTAETMTDRLDWVMENANSPAYKDRIQEDYRGVDIQGKGNAGKTRNGASIEPTATGQERAAANPLDSKIKQALAGMSPEAQKSIKTSFRDPDGGSPDGNRVSGNGQQRSNTTQVC